MLITDSYIKNKLSEISLIVPVFHLTIICVVLSFWNPSALFLVLPLFLLERYKGLLLLHKCSNKNKRGIEEAIANTEPYTLKTTIEQSLVDEIQKYEMTKKINVLNDEMGTKRRIKILKKKNGLQDGFTTFDTTWGESLIVLPSYYSGRPSHVVKLIHELRHTFGHASSNAMLAFYLCYLLFICASAIILYFEYHNLILAIIVAITVLFFGIEKILNNTFGKELDADIGTIRVFSNYAFYHPDYLLEPEKNRTLTQTAAFYLQKERKSFRASKYLLPFLNKDDLAKVFEKNPSWEGRNQSKLNNTSNIYLSNDNFGEFVIQAILLVFGCFFSIQLLGHYHFHWIWITSCIIPSIMTIILRFKIQKTCQQIE